MNYYHEDVYKRQGQFFAPVMMGGWEALSPTQDLIDSYPCKDGKSIRESPFYNPEDPFADRDPRLGFSVLWNGSQIAGKTFNLNNMGDGSHTRTGYSMKKYINPDLSLIHISDSVKP